MSNVHRRKGKRQGHKQKQPDERVERFKRNKRLNATRRRCV